MASPRSPSATEIDITGHLPEQRRAVEVVRLERQEIKFIVLSEVALDHEAMPYTMHRAVVWRSQL